MIGLIIPAHNEEKSIARCLDAALTSAAHPALGARRVEIVVVLDSCTDDTAKIVAKSKVAALNTNARSVGVARAIGANYMLQRGATWLAFTDADSVVSENWLSKQVALGADAVCGTVSVHDWHLHSADLRARYEQHYVDADGHSHIHGANLGVCAAAYRKVGGFPPVPVNEDVALVRSLMSEGAQVVFSAAPRVSTSARINNRVAGGFGGFVKRLKAGVRMASPGNPFLAA